jgi:hypothetical protein
MENFYSTLVDRVRSHTADSEISSLGSDFNLVVCGGPYRSDWFVVHGWSEKSFSNSVERRALGINYFS